MTPPDFPDIANLGAPVYVAFILAELVMIRLRRAKGEYETRDTATSLAMGLGSVVADALGAAVSVGILMAAWELRLFDWGFSIAAIVACFVLDDFRFYWTHRLAHRSRWFWADHVIHHSSQHYNLSTALRQPWTGLFTGLFLFRAPLALLGFHPAIVAFCAGLNLFYQFFVHTETVKRLHPWIEAVFNTPSHHRVHHARNPAYLDSNYAGVLIVWDRLFGTFVPEDDRDPCRYGLVKGIATFNPLRVAFHEWIGIARDQARPGLSLKDRLGYLFAPPGWSHDGSRLGSEAVKAEWLARHPDQADRPGLRRVARASGKPISDSAATSVEPPQVAGGASS